MTMAPEASEVAGHTPGPVRLIEGGSNGVGAVGEVGAGAAAGSWLCGRDWSVRVLSSYAVPGPSNAALLHSLADVVGFVCVECLEWCEATLVAIRFRCLVCPGCFSRRPAAGSNEPGPDVTTGAGESPASPVRAGLRRAPWTVRVAGPCHAAGPAGWSRTGGH